MNRFNSARYVAELDRVTALDLHWNKLCGKSVVISGATGMIGSFFVDVIMHKNDCSGLGCKVTVLGRDESKALNRLPYFGRDDFSFEEMDVSDHGVCPRAMADFVVHLASSTHPRAYASDPVGTIEVNVEGLRNMLEYAAVQHARLLCTSSVEIYGENRGDVERFDEHYCGYIDCNTMRACYTESKRLGEALCQAYRSEKDVDTVVARVARSYGPTLLPDDSKALSQFIHRALAGEDVVLKSAGTQRYSYLYVADVVSGLLSVLTAGVSGEAYNLADDTSDITLRELAELVARKGKSTVIFDTPDLHEAEGYSKATLALMDATKAHQDLRWKPAYGIEDGVSETLSILKELTK